MSNDVGRPSELDNPEMLTKIEALVLQGKNDVEIYTELRIPRTTWETWKLTNYRGFKDTFTTYKHEYMLSLAEVNLQRHMMSDEEKISLDASKFVAETLGKKKYSKRQETDITSNGKTIIPILGGISTNEVHTNDSTQENSSTTEA